MPSEAEIESAARALFAITHPAADWDRFVEEQDSHGSEGAAKWHKDRAIETARAALEAAERVRAQNNEFPAESVERCVHLTHISLSQVKLVLRESGYTELVAALREVRQCIYDNELLGVIDAALRKARAELL